jgi:hypothetical protein
MKAVYFGLLFPDTRRRGVLPQPECAAPVGSLSMIIGRIERLTSQFPK